MLFMRRLSFSVLPVLLGAMILSGCNPPPLPPKAGLQIGDIAPDIEGEDIDGKEFKLSDYRGKVVVLSFWAMW
jgi:hypothetical protein